MRSKNWRCSGLQDFEQEPEDAWQKINAKLDSKTITSYKDGWYLRGAALLFFLLCVGFIFFERPSTLNGEQQVELAIE